MKTTLLTLSLFSIGLLAQAQTTKPKTTSTTSTTKPASTTVGNKPVTSAAKTTTSTTSKPTTATTAKPTATGAPSATATKTTPSTTTPMAGTRPATATSQTSAPASSATRTTAASKPVAAPTAKNVYDGTGFSVGLRAGGNVILNNLEDDLSLGGVSPSGSAKKVPGFTAGVIINYGFSSTFSIQPEILYTRRSIKYGGEYLGQTLSVQLDANSVEVPLLLKLSFGERTRFFVNAGPYINYGLDGRLKLNIAGETSTEKQKYEGSDGRLEYGATGGVGVSLPLGPGSLLVEGRFTYGLGDNSKDKTVDYISPQIATLSVGYIIPLNF